MIAGNAVKERRRRGETLGKNGQGAMIGVGDGKGPTVGNYDRAQQE